MRAHNRTSPETTFFALDFDRCLGDVTSLADFFVDVAEDMDIISRSQLEAARKETEQSGGSFDMLGYLRHVMGEKAVQIVLSAYGTKPVGNEVSFLLPGAKELLDYLNAYEIPHGIVTYGGEQWQRAKIGRSGLSDVPTVVVSTPEKGRVLADWYDEDKGVYVLPGELGDDRQADSVVLVDDKAKAFDGFDEMANARGYWVQSGELLASQRGSVPENVRTVQSLEDIVNYEQNILT